MHWVSLKHFLQKFSKYTAKLEEFYNDPLYIYHLDFTINIFFDKASHNLSIHVSLPVNLPNFWGISNTSP